ncbi:MAG: ABC transporter ATP-binding protein [Planctomycetota bacterium]|nr:ABC transporter ATP-binding protein [Planctomycetota bacterium]
MIELDKVRRTYGNKVAVAGLDLKVDSGELFAFLGPNGAGKTTTIKMLVGLLRPSSGTLKVCGYNVVDQSREANHLLGYVPDEPYLYDKLTGREFLQFVGDMHGLSNSEIQLRTDREIANFALHEFVDELSENYSHGMKQRLAFAASLMHDPAVLIVDEPMVGLDPRSARLVKDLLRRKASEGTTVFMSTHSLAVAEEISDRIGVVDRGKLRFLGTLADLRFRLAQEQTSLEDLYLALTSQAADESDAHLPADADVETPVND